MSSEKARKFGWTFTKSNGLAAHCASGCGAKSWKIFPSIDNQKIPSPKTKMGRKRKVSFKEPPKPGKQGGLRGGKALNTFHIDDEDFSKESLEAEEELDEDEDGQVKSEDDEDIDSDEAFDESDEERFSSFKFSGSSSNGVKVRILWKDGTNFSEAKVKRR